MLKQALATIVIALAVFGCSKQTAAPTTPGPASDQQAEAPHGHAPQDETPLPNASSAIVRLAQAITAASPSADPSDPAARDAAASVLAELRPLAEVSEFHIYWGPLSPTSGFDLIEARLTQLQPLVAAKLYLSLFMFSGEYQIREEEGATVVELSASFRDRLPLGDYPHPLWSTPEEWEGYARVSSVLLVLRGERLGAIMLKSDTEREVPAVPSWNGRWRWLDASGVEQPRVSKYEYLFSPENPHVQPLREAFGKLEVAFAANRCVACHAPDNKARMTHLTILTHQNQALSSRHAIAAVLRAETMPPGDVRRGIPPGVHDVNVLQDMIAKADEFDRAASDAIKFEEQRLQSPPSTTGR